LNIWVLTLGPPRSPTCFVYGGPSLYWSDPYDFFFFRGDIEPANPRIVRPSPPSTISPRVDFSWDFHANGLYFDDLEPFELPPEKGPLAKTLMTPPRLGFCSSIGRPDGAGPGFSFFFYQLSVCCRLPFSEGDSTTGSWSWSLGKAFEDGAFSSSQSMYSFEVLLAYLYFEIALTFLSPNPPRHDLPCETPFLCCDLSGVRAFILLYSPRDPLRPFLD